MTPCTLAVLNLGPVQFHQPAWLLILIPAWLLTVWMGRSSLATSSSMSRRVALAIRLIVLGVLAGAMSGPSLRRQSRDVAVTVVTDASKSVPLPVQADADTWVRSVVDAHMKDDDRLGVITVAQDSFVQSLPAKRNRQVDRTFIGATEGTDLSAGLRLALAVRPGDAAYRVLLASDGKETIGSLIQAAEAAKAANVPVDVLLLTHSADREVMVEELVAPPTARAGESVNLRLKVTATRPTSGRISLLLNGETVDLDAASDATGWPVTLDAGSQVLTIPLPLKFAGPQEFQATFQPDDGPDGRPMDTIIENNRALGVTFVSGEGRVLILTENTAEAEQLDVVLRTAKFRTTIQTPQEGPNSLTQFNAYEAIFLVNVPSYSFTQKQMEDLRQYVHDGGGGLVMVGGPDSFGAGGWIGTPVEDALPVKLDPPQKRQMPRGALVLVMHSIEMPQGIHYGKATARAAVDGLSRLDLVGINEYTGRGQGTEWIHPLSEVGDKSAVNRAVNGLLFGDMPSFDPSLELTLEALENVEAGLKHAIIISDGDPSLNRRILDKFIRAKITISTVGVFPHSPGDLGTLQFIAQKTGGRFYPVTNQGQLATLPQIFFKEAQIVRRPMIWEGDPFSPAVVSVISEPMRGISSVPPITGYVVAADREGLATVTLRGKENDPIAAHWQYGLGRSVAITTDAAARWTTLWRNWDQFQAFWEQHARWVMRASGDANMRVLTERQGENTRLIVEGVDGEGERVNFATIAGRVARPDGKGEDVELVQVGPGRYEGLVKTDVPGSFVVSLKYKAPRPSGETLEGAVQAAITLPFADEYRALEDNSALLRQVAAMTGGKVLTLDAQGAAEAELWRREGVTMPVALTPVALAVVIACLALFLADVAVRRVRIDIPAMIRAVGRSFGRSKQKAGQQMDSLRAAREKAREKISDRAGEADRAEAPIPTSVAQSSKVKFEATDEQRARATGPVALSGGADSPKPTSQRPKPATPASGEDPGLSRLMKAKRRAQEGYDADRDDQPKT